MNDTFGNSGFDVLVTRGIRIIGGLSSECCKLGNGSFNRVLSRGDYVRDRVNIVFALMFKWLCMKHCL